MKPHEALETILHHLQHGKGLNEREELRAAIDDLKDWCDEMNEVKERGLERPKLEIKQWQIAPEKP